MKKQNKNINSAGQRSIEVRKSQKHEVNLQKKLHTLFSNWVNPMLIRNIRPF